MWPSKLDDSDLLSGLDMMLPLFHLFSQPLSLTVCLFVSVHTHVSTSVSLKPSRGRRQKRWWFCFACLKPPVCVSRSLPVSVFFPFSPLIFLSGPVLGQADQLGRFLLWSASHPPISRLMTTASKTTDSGKRVFNYPTGYTLTHTHTTSPFVYLSVLSLRAHKTIYINTVLDTDTCAHTDKLFFKNAHTFQSPIPCSN